MGSVSSARDAVARASKLVAGGARIVAVREATGADATARELRRAVNVPIAIVSGRAALVRRAIAAGATLVRVDAVGDVAPIVNVCAETGAGLIAPADARPELLSGLAPEQCMLSVSPGPEPFAPRGAPAERPLLVLAEAPVLAASLASVAWGTDAQASVLAVADIGAAADFLAVYETLRGGRDIAPGLRLPDELRREPPVHEPALEHPST
jgi:hypothetical protein